MKAPAPFVSARPPSWGRPGRIAVPFWFALVAAIALGCAIAPYLKFHRAPPAGQPPPTPQNIWALLAREAPRYQIAPAFAYALAQAESDLDPYTYNHGGARGLLQVRPAAWDTVSAAPFHDAWNWETNARVALAYLQWCQTYLNAHHAYSLPLLAACYHDGPEAVADAGFQIARLPRPRNALYRQIYDGDPAPVPQPSG